MRRTGIVLAVIVALTVAGFYVSTETAFAAKKTSANLSASIPNAKSTFISHEQECTADLAASRSKLGNNRSAINDANLYKYNNWISLRNQPSVTTTPVYAAGNVSVNLQFNQYLFLCGTLVSPASGGATSSAGNRVTNSQYPNDRNPVRSSGSINRADLVQKDAKVVRAQVVSGGGSISSMTGQKRSVTSHDDSRYSSGSTIPFTYNGNLSSTTTIEIQMTFIEVRSYHGTPTSSSATVMCDYVTPSGSLVGHQVSGNGVSNIDVAFNDSRCNREITKTYSIQIRVSNPPTWNLSVSSQNRVKSSSTAAFGSYANNREGVNSPRTVYPGNVVQWQHEIRNTGNSTAKFDRWRDRKGLDTSSYILVGSHIAASLGAGGSVRYPLHSSNVMYTIKQADVGKTICERYVVKGRSNSNSSQLGSVGSCVYVSTNWTLTGTTTMKVNGTTRTGSLTSPTNVKTGDSINWTQTLRNNGPYQTHRPVAVGTLVQDYNSATGGMTGQNVLSSATIATGWASGATRSWQNGNAGNGYSYTVKSTDVGKILCRRLQWDPRSWNDTNAAQTYSVQRCVRVPYNFNLQPNISNPPPSVAPGENLEPVEPRVTNDVPGGGTTVTPDGIQWQLTRYELDPGEAKPANTTNGTIPCSYFSNGCTIKDQGTRSFPSGSTPLNNLTGEQVPADMEIGSKICYGLSVQPYSSSSNNWRHYSVCLGVNKHPSVHVWGGDLRVGGSINTATTRGIGGVGGGSKTFGSWVEYGAFSVGANSGLASGSALAGGVTGASLADRNKLTFANRSGNYGNYAYTTAYDIAGQFAPGSAAATNVGATFTIGGGTASGTYAPTGATVNVRGTIAKGRTIVLYAPSASVTITNDILYGGEPYTSRGQIPQLVIVARNIYIREGVEKVNAWLLASNVVDTCSNVGTAGVMPSGSGGGAPVPGALYDGVCNKMLTVNGPVSTNRLVLKRTAGGEASAQADPAEVFNLRADAYLWRYGDAAGSGQVRVISVKELPPRF